MNSSNRRWHEGLGLAQMLALLLLALSYLRIFGDSQSMAFSSLVLDSMFVGSIWGTTLGDNLVRFALGVLCVHLLYGALCWIMGQLSLRAWPSDKTSLRQHVILWFIALTVGALANNAAVFTSSSLGQPYAEAMNIRILGLPLGRGIFVLVLAAAAVTALLGVFRWWRAGGRFSRRGALALGALGASWLAVSAHTFLPERISRAPADKPNVILIGIDSLREDLLDDPRSPGVTPHIMAFMKRGTQFTNAMTPLARTFPSMCAMLTGRHPHTSGAVMNLLPREIIDDSGSLPRVLGSMGYHTVYATDETRFANIDGSFGFEETITPPIGSSEFLIEKIADTPVLNLVVNTRLGEWLFPHVHANRGASKTYDPDTFVERVDRKLAVDEQPAFVVAHLTLGHWPYMWAGAPPRQKGKGERWPPYYLHAVQRVDQQFADLMDVFERKGLLNNAIVVVYSDHGESFGVTEESLVPDEDPLIHALGVEPVWGHGSTVLTTHQFHIVLGMQRFGGHWKAGNKVSAPVSFEDIAPTILDALRLEPTLPQDGRSLLALIQGDEGAEQPFAGRIRFTETEYQPPTDFASVDGEVSPSKIAYALSVYSVDRLTDRITIKKSHLGQLLVQRQYAAIGDRHLVAAFPRKDQPGFNYLAVSLAGGAPRQLFEPPTSDEPELLELWLALKSKFAVLRETPAPVATSAVAIRGRTIPASVTK